MFDFDTIHPRRGTGSLKWDRRPDLDPFWVADMDFTSPPAVIDALQQRVAHGIFGYALPHDGLKEALHGYFSSRHGLEIGDETIVHLGGLVPRCHSRAGLLEAPMAPSSPALRSTTPFSASTATTTWHTLMSPMC